MKWSTFKLCKLTKTQNSIGQLVSDWSYVQDIDVVESHKLYTNVINDVIYQKFMPSAISKFKSFEQGETYKITNNKHEYLVDSFNVGGRYAQLTLSEVALNE